MADRIKGITIEIDGNTKGLSQALKGVNKDIKTTQTQLKDVEKLLKLDPRNVTLLGQKMELLGKEIGSTKEKLNQLKSVKDQMEEGLKNGSVTAEQYQAWQREIIQTENELKNLETQLRNVPTAAEAMVGQISDKMDQLGGKISAVGDKVAGVGDKMSSTVTAGIVAAGAASIQSWKEVDSAMDTVIKKTGATGASLEEMEGIVNSIATTIPTDFATAAEAVGEVNTRFDATGKTLEDLSTAFIKFSDLNGTQVSDSVDSVSALMKAWGLDTKDTISVLNTLNGVAQNTGASTADLANLLQSNALSFKEMDYNVAEAATLLGQFEKNGVDASTGVTALRKAMVKATNDGTNLNVVMSEWEELMASNASETEKLAATEELFGSRAFAQLYNAIQEGNISFTDINASMSDFSGNVEKTFDATLDPIDEFTTTMNDLKILGAEIGEEVLPVLVDVLKDLKPILDDLKTAWESMSEEEQKQLIENLGKLAAIGPALSISGRAIGGLGSGISGLAKAGKALSGLGIGAKIGSLFGASGAGATGAGAAAGVGTTIGTAIIGGIAAALGGGAVAELLDNFVIGPILDVFGSDSADWYKNFDWFGDGGFFDEIFDFGSLEEAKEVYVGAFAQMGEDMFSAIDTRKENLIGAFTDIGEGTYNAIETAKKDVSDSWSTMQTDLETGFNNVKGFFEEGWGLVKETTSGAWDTVKETVSTAWDNVKGTITEFRDGIFEKFGEIYDKIKEIWDNLGELFDAGFNLKLPHISVTGGVAPYGIGGQGSLPKFNVDWYANGGILTQPTIFGMQGGRFLGGGEAGAEAVLPLSNLEEMIVNGMTAALGGSGDTIINVSIDNNNLGSVLLSAQQMMNLRRGK